MIVVTRLNDSQFAINPDLIERIHQAPDTTIVMVDGRKYIVTEPMHEVIEMIAAYRARVVAMATQIPSAVQGSRRLELAVDDSGRSIAADSLPADHEPIKLAQIQPRKS